MRRARGMEGPGGPPAPSGIAAGARRHRCHEPTTAQGREARPHAGPAVPAWSRSRPSEFRRATAWSRSRPGAVARSAGCRSGHVAAALRPGCEPTRPMSPPPAAMRPPAAPTGRDRAVVAQPARASAKGRGDSRCCPRNPSGGSTGPGRPGIRGARRSAAGLRRPPTGSMALASPRHWMPITATARRPSMCGCRYSPAASAAGAGVLGKARRVLGPQDCCAVGSARTACRARAPYGPQDQADYGQRSFAQRRRKDSFMTASSIAVSQAASSLAAAAAYS